MTNSSTKTTPSKDAIRVSALRLAQTPRVAHFLAIFLALLTLVSPMILIFIPWRQSVSGSGKVVGYAPLDRQFNVEAPIYGRVQEWFVVEGTLVHKGDLIARISDNDSQYLESLRSQRDATEEKEHVAESEISLYEEVTKRFCEIREVAISAASSYVDVATQKVQAQQQEKAAAEAARDADRSQFQRLARLVPQGLASSRDLELAEQKYKESNAKVQKADADLAGAKLDVEAKKLYLREVTAKTQAEIEKSRAEEQKARGKLAETQKDVQDMMVKLRRQQTQDVLAPRDGTILRLLVNQGTEQVKDGDPIAIIVPDAATLAVELKLDGNDTPLVRPGDPARLQFEGWPAVQFTGWPSVSVGSFGARVALIDSTDDGKGKFRILLVPEASQAWPSARYLRQGVRAKGWVLLREVPLGYELWRRLNGFPQTVAESEPTTGNKGKGAAESDDYEVKEKIKIKRPK